MTDMKQMVLTMLNEYPKKKLQIDLLRYELDSFVPISDDELIESLALVHSQNEAVGKKTSRISDRTMQIAGRYEKLAQRMNSDACRQIARELHELLRDVDRIEYYVSRLGKDHGAIIQAHFFEGKSLAQIREESRLSERAVLHRKNAAIKALVNMFDYVCRSGGGRNE